MQVQEATFVAVDIETTGLDIKRDEIIAFAAIPIRRMRICVGEAFYTTFKPERYRIHGMKYHGIGEAELDRSPRFEAVAETLWIKLDGILVGHGLAIDHAFLKKYFKKCGRRLARNLVDVAQLERWIGGKQCRSRCSEELTLEALIDRYKLKEHYRHHALADAFFAAQIFQIQVTSNGIATVEQLLEIMKACRLAHHHVIF